MKKYCIECGENIPETAKYCPHCGTKQNDNDDYARHLDTKERLLYLLLTTIIRAVSNDYDKEYYNKQIEVLKNGFSLHYNELFSQINNDEMTNDECKEVLDILDMYSSIIKSFNYLKNNGIQLKELTENDVLFPGFDSNNENKQYLYSNFFMYKLDRFKDVQDHLINGDLNSHQSVLDKYKEQLKKWKSMKDSGKNVYQMQETELSELLNIC